jgi:hypothetical protein
MICGVMRMAAKDFLGGIFIKWPSLKDLGKRIRGKLGYLPRDDSIPEGYSIDTYPPFMPPVIYHIRTRLMRQF